MGCAGREPFHQDDRHRVVRLEHTGSTSWDGYAAACVCDAGVRALTDDGVVKVEMIAKPAFYA